MDPEWIGSGSKFTNHSGSSTNPTLKKVPVHIWASARFFYGSTGYVSLCTMNLTTLKHLLEPDLDPYRIHLGPVDPDPVQSDKKNDSKKGAEFSNWRTWGIFCNWKSVIKAEEYRKYFVKFTYLLLWDSFFLFRLLTSHFSTPELWDLPLPSLPTNSSRPATFRFLFQLFMSKANLGHTCIPAMKLEAQSNVLL